MKQILIVGLGGFAGSILRFLLSKLNFSIQFHAIPVGTLAVNIIGSFAIGLIMGLSLKYFNISDNLKLLLITGFCGGFTTFSAFAIENLMLFQSGQILTAVIYTATTLILGFAAVYLGYGLMNNG
jgi:CrcB protein